jgi:hypothetical protein
MPGAPERLGVEHARRLLQVVDADVAQRPDAEEPRGPLAGRPGPNEGDLFSNTATSKLSGISVGRPGAEGASGSRSSGGRNARFWRAVAMEIHSPVSGSSRSCGTGGRGSGGRSSAFRSGGSAVSASSK